MAKHSLVNEKVLIKVLEKKLLRLNKDLSKLETEIQILRNIRHQNIIQLFEVHISNIQILESTQNIYMVFEFGEGDTLQQKVNQQQKFSEAQALIYLHQIVKAVQYLHQNSIAHCKIRLENIVFLNGKPKLIDFSDAQRFDQQIDKEISSIKLQYQSPEMLNQLYFEFDGQQYDIWCLGLILFQMLQGQLPFDNITNNNDLKGKIKKATFNIIYPISQHVLQLLESMLHVDPKKRITIDELFKFLENLNFQFEDEVLKMPDEISTQLIIRELESLQIETNNIIELLEQNKHCSLTTCYYLIRNKLLKRTKNNKIKASLMSTDNARTNYMNKLRNSLQFATTKSRMYQNGARVQTEGNSKLDCQSQSQQRQKSVNKGKRQQIGTFQQQFTSKYSNTQQSFYPQSSTKSNQSYNQNFSKLGIICDGYQLQQERLQAKLKNLLYNYNNNYVVQITKTKRRSVTQQN